MLRLIERELASERGANCIRERERCSWHTRGPRASIGRRGFAYKRRRARSFYFPARLHGLSAPLCPVSGFLPLATFNFLTTGEKGLVRENAIMALLCSFCRVNDVRLFLFFNVVFAGKLILDSKLR